MPPATGGYTQELSLARAGPGGGKQDKEPNSIIYFISILSSVRTC
jgi:hypothetical protein